MLLFHLLVHLVGHDSAQMKHLNDMIRQAHGFRSPRDTHSRIFFLFF